MLKKQSSEAEVYLSYNLHVQSNQILATHMYEGAGEIDTAIRLYTSLMANPETVGGNLEEIVNAFDRLKRPDLAIQACIQMLTTNKTDELRMISAIRRLEAAGNITEAAKGWEKAIFHPRMLLSGLSAWHRNEGAEFFERHNQLDLAIKVYNSVFEMRFPCEANLPLESTAAPLSKTVAALVRLGRRDDAISGLTGILNDSKTTPKEKEKARHILTRIKAIKPD